VAGGGVLDVVVPVLVVEFLIEADTPDAHAPEVGRGRPSKSSSPTPRLAMFTPAPIAGEVAWRWRS
jgi:hypothetical protein